MITTNKNDSLRWRWLRWVIYFFGFLFIACVACSLYLLAGLVGGVEFDVTSWKTRKFQFVVDPFTDSQLTYIYYDSSQEFVIDPVIAPFLAGGVIRPANPRWDLVSIYRSISSAKGEAGILLRYLQAKNVDDELTWVVWTNKNASTAPIFWGAVRDAVHLQRYDRLHAIFEAARLDTSPATLKKTLDEIMLTLAIDDASRHRQSGNAKAARTAALVGLAYGDSHELRTLVGESDNGTAGPGTKN